MPTPARFDRAFAALAHPARRRIVERLTRGPARVTELAAPFDMSLTHTGLPSEDSANQHQGGWSEFMDILATRV